MNQHTEMYKSTYKVIEGLPLTQTIPLLLEWKGVSPQRVELDSGGRISQVNIHRICSGQTRNPGIGILEGIAQYFGLTASQILDPNAVQQFIAKKQQPRSALEAALQGILESDGHSKIPSVTKDASVSYSSSSALSAADILPLLRRISHTEFVSLVLTYMPLLPPQDRIAIAQAALLDIPASDEHQTSY
jgi:hypothetical protein